MTSGMTSLTKAFPRSSSGLVTFGTRVHKSGRSSLSWPSNARCPLMSALWSRTPYQIFLLERLYCFPEPMGKLRFPSSLTVTPILHGHSLSNRFKSTFRSSMVALSESGITLVRWQSLIWLALQTTNDLGCRSKSPCSSNTYRQPWMLARRMHRGDRAV